MIDGLTITLAGILQGGAGVIVAIICLMALSGRLVSRKVHEERVNDAKEVATMWRTAHETSETARRETESLARESLETSRAVLHLMHSLRSITFVEGEKDVAAPPE